MARTSSPVNTATFLEAALEGLQLQKQRIEEQIAQVRGMLGHGKGSSPKAAAKSAATTTTAAPVAKERRKLSAAARKRIAIAQKKRWAAYRKELAAGKSE